MENVDIFSPYGSHSEDLAQFFNTIIRSRILNCAERHVLTNGNLTLQCQREGQWIGEAPVCNVTCQEPTHENSTTIRQAAPSPKYFVNHIFQTYTISYACRKNHRLVKGNLTRVCNESGDWTGDQPVCKRCKCPCERLKSQNFITDPQVLQNRIKEMEKELKINEKALSTTVRKKTCAKDERKSAKGIGSVLGIGIIALVVSIIVCSDIPILYRHIRYGPESS
uniref:Sushi, von Willebrand factor type A, EGF and pentraxin domain-containing protein 1 n=1 Tax=Magallana gigas TaxID=29159 RepID=K1PQ33_MAGGI